MPGTTGKTLLHVHNMSIRFNEVDSMGIVWHGHYVQYLEEAREQFGLREGIDYLTIAAQGYRIPVVDMQIKYRRSLRYGDYIRIECEYVDTIAAKIIFRYSLYNASDGQLCASAETVQVFIDENEILQLTYPGFFLEWKRKAGLLS